MTKYKYTAPRLHNLSEAEKHQLLDEIARILFLEGEVTNEQWNPDAWAYRDVADREEDCAHVAVTQICDVFRKAKAAPIWMLRSTTIAPFAAIIDPKELVRACENHSRNHPLGIWRYARVLAFCNSIGVTVDDIGVTPEFVDFGGFND